MAIRFGLEKEMNALAEAAVKGKRNRDTKKMAKFLLILEIVMRDTWGVLTTINADQTRDMLDKLGYRRIKATHEYETWQRGIEKEINMPTQRGGQMDMVTNQKMAAWANVASAEFRRVEYLMTEVLLINSDVEEFKGKPIDHAPAITG